MLRLRNIFIYEYFINDKVEFFNKYGIWVKGVVIGFKVTDYVYKAVIKCENKNCKFHYICICSTYLRKIQ